jgi:putative PIN family toxin of toxin-antitoxin system
VRVLLDVNILVRANEKSQGPARRLLLDLIARKHVILTSADILIELARVLRYPRAQALFGLSEEQIYQYVQFLKDACKIVPINPSWNFPIRDASDTPILRTAVAGKPTLVVCPTPSLQPLTALAFSSTPHPRRTV